MTSLCGFENLMLPDTTLYAGNEPLKTTDVEHDEDPCSGAVFTDIPIASMADVDAVVSAAKAAFHHASWRNLAPLQRERLLHRFADAIEADLPRLAALEALDTGKPVAAAEAVDIPAAVAWLRTHAGWPSKLGGRTGALAATAGDFHVYTRREPVGVVAAITPWNFPIVLSMWKIAPALAAGCTVILKPAAETRILLADPSFPFGGMKRSGVGRENGPEGLEPYLEPKSVVMALS